MQIIFLIRALICVFIFQNTIYAAYAISDQPPVQSPLNQKSEAETAQSPKTSRQISLSSLLNADKKNFLNKWGTFTPKKFQIFVNGEEIEDDTTKKIIINDNQIVARRTYTFSYWPITMSGDREFTFQLSPDREEFTLDFDWKSTEQVEALNKKTSLPIKTNMQFIISYATYLKGFLEEAGGEHA